MITGIDHIVIAVQSLERAIASYRALGFTVVAGGRHPFGSHNALIGFADGSYIELLAFFEDSPAHPWWALLHERGGGLVDFCMASDDIRADLERLRAAGVAAGELTEGGRRRPDGYEVRWINNKVTGALQGLVPFLIEDVTPRRERLPTQTSHENGVTGIGRIRLATADLQGCVDAMSEGLRQEAESQQDAALDAVAARFTVGGHRLEYLSPRSESGPVQAHLAANRPAPYGVDFRTLGESRSFSLEETEGARIVLA